MKKIIALMSLALLSALSGCGTLGESDDGFSELFSRDLSNATCKEAVWSFDDDGVLSSTKDVILFSKKDYQNFEAEFEFNIEKGANGGFIVYASDLGDWTNNSLEIQICDSSSFPQPAWRCGAIFGHVKPEIDTQLSFGEWHKMRVVCKGQVIDAWIDGRHVSKINLADWTDKKFTPDGLSIPLWLTKNRKCDLPTKGKIGLQGKHGSADCRYRNIKVRAL